MPWASRSRTSPGSSTRTTPTCRRCARTWRRSAGDSQPNISRIEHQDDAYLSTLRSYVEALGGRLEVRAVFEDQTVELDVASTT